MRIHLSCKALDDEFLFLFLVFFFSYKHKSLSLIILSLETELKLRRPDVAIKLFFQADGSSAHFISMPTWVKLSFTFLLGIIKSRLEYMQFVHSSLSKNIKGIRIWRDQQQDKNINDYCTEEN